LQVAHSYRAASGDHDSWRGRIKRKQAMVFNISRGGIAGSAANGVPELD